jgi:murein DD-endopeptidase MepM/ murein hydrolase activator NlpD
MKGPLFTISTLLLVLPATFAMANKSGSHSSKRSRSNHHQQVQDNSVWIWSDKTGIIERSDCRVTPTNTIGLQLSAVTPGGASASTTSSLMVVKDQEGTNLAAPDSISPHLADFVVAPTNEKTLGNSNLPIKGSFWQATMSGDRYVSLVCGQENKIYTLFDVYVADREDRLMQVGVNADEITLFKDSKIYTPGEAETVISAEQSQNSAKGKNNSAKKSLSSGKNSKGGRSSNSNSNSNSNSASLPNLRTQAIATPTSPSTNQSTNPAGNPSPTNNPANTSKPATPTVSPSADFNTTSLSNETGNALTTPAATSELDPVICSANNSSKVLANDFKQVLTTAKSLETVRIIQGFSGKDEKTRSVHGHKVQFTHIQLIERSGNRVGWIQSDLIKQKSDCALVTKPSEPTRPEPTTPPAVENSENCCNFPMADRAQESYLEAPRKFRSLRSKGRIHAACDLYRPEGEEVTTVSPGEVIRDRYYFYEGVYAIEVRHDDGRVVRYGEVNGRVASGIHQGARVSQGQTIGYVGWINTRAAPPMLHFELYSGTATGPLSQPWRKGFERRSDLLDPTALLLKWEDKKFGSQ